MRLGVGPPLPAYSRLKVALRIFLLIPVALIAYAMQIVASIAALIAWFAIVITGKLPEGIHQMLRLGLSYKQRALPYFLLLTEDWPTFTVDDEAARPLGARAAGAAGADPAAGGDAARRPSRARRTRRRTSATSARRAADDAA